MRKDQFVEWTITTSEHQVIERAGKIVCVVPPFTHPNEVYPGHLFNDNLAVRGDESYLVMIPDYNVVMWPAAKALISLKKERMYLLFNQPKPSLRVKSISSKADRIKLRMLAHKLGDEVTESSILMTIPAWGKRFYFETENGVEFIKSIEDL